MQDITAILIDYTAKPSLYKALESLKGLKSRLQAIIILQNDNILLEGAPEGEIQFISIDDNDTGKTLNTTLSKIESSYVLILRNADYLAGEIKPDTLSGSNTKLIVETISINKNIKIQQPFLIHKSLYKKHPFLEKQQLPFKEALLSTWLSQVSCSNKFITEGLVKQARKDTSANSMAKLRFIQKYQIEKTKSEHPSLAILISNYNMEKYVETAIASCVLQNEQAEQLLVMDDGSTDNSVKQIQHWKNKGVTIVEKKNEGKAIALNTLLPYVYCDFILELDADDWLDADAVFVIKRYLAQLPEEHSLIYGNLRKWKQLTDDVRFKGITKGRNINGNQDLLNYRFPLGPRIYRTSILKKAGGFPVVAFEKGRLYEDVSVLRQLMKTSHFCYHDFTVYNVREHKESITKNHTSSWNEFLNTLT